jgi:hypothetical protein
MKKKIELSKEEQEESKREIDKLIPDFPDVEDTRERLIITEFPEHHILTSLKYCPSCGGGRLSILETTEQSFLFCPSCENVIYEMEIKKRYFSPKDFKIYERLFENLCRKNEELSRIWEERQYLKKLQVDINFKEEAEFRNKNRESQNSL